VWAGAGFGSMHVPRIGQEVLVSFLEGDPDRPMITGRVYNGSVKPPYPLPSKAAVSGIKSESTPKGGGYNELSMDDSKGKEQLSLHAQRDMQTDVENDYKLAVKKAASISAKTGSVECTESLELKVGQASIVLKPDQVELKLGATKIVLNATGIKVDGMQIDIKGQMIKQKAALISIN
jgi:type VI secretion system secreted protein VgrG